MRDHDVIPACTSVTAGREIYILVAGGVAFIAQIYFTRQINKYNSQIQTDINGLMSGKFGGINIFGSGNRCRGKDERKRYNHRIRGG